MTEDVGKMSKNYVFNNLIATISIEKSLQCHTCDIEYIEHSMIVRISLTGEILLLKCFPNKVTHSHSMKTTVNRLIEASPITTAVDMKCTNVIEAKASLKQSTVSNRPSWYSIHAIKCLLTRLLSLTSSTFIKLTSSTAARNLQERIWNWAEICEQADIKTPSRPGNESVVIAPPSAVCM